MFNMISDNDLFVRTIDPYTHTHTHTLRKEERKRLKLLF